MAKLNEKLDLELPDHNCYKNGNKIRTRYCKVIKYFLIRKS